ncbi:NUDIX hydrolase [Solitalea koreensis]|uniref:GDP-mannose pyrophosphatase n=1 Tax=Solitalea koreensis TaxID=543615 RepID=A0A521ARY5_9SPHI|nr:NUDIX hydrolase [Solitalea koreensis]SMO37400.1 NUDIX domain-containing protein [Solitalea koreensis]
MSKNLNWKKLSSNYLLKDSWATLRVDTCETPEGKIVTPYYVLEYSNWANAVAITEENKVLMVRQYRHGAGKVMLEIPGGVIDEGEQPIESIRRELLEETGYEFNHIEATAVIYPNPSTSNNLTYCFLARGGKKTQEQQLDHSEDIIVEEISIDELKHLALTNQLPQALHTASVFYALLKLGKL